MMVVVVVMMMMVRVQGGPGDCGGGYYLMPYLYSFRFGQLVVSC